MLYNEGRASNYLFYRTTDVKKLGRQRRISRYNLKILSFTVAAQISSTVFLKLENANDVL